MEDNQKRILIGVGTAGGLVALLALSLVIYVVIKRDLIGSKFYIFRMTRGAPTIKRVELKKSTGFLYLLKVRFLDENSVDISPKIPATIRSSDPYGDLDTRRGTNVYPTFTAGSWFYSKFETDQFIKITPDTPSKLINKILIETDTTEAPNMDKVTLTVYDVLERPIIQIPLGKLAVQTIPITSA